MNILDVNFCENSSFLQFIYLIKLFFNIIKIVIPLILIIIVCIDFYHSIFDSDKMDKVINKSLKRFVAAIIIFFIPSIVVAFSNIFRLNYTVFVECLNNATVDNINKLKQQRKDEIEKERIKDKEQMIEAEKNRIKEQQTEVTPNIPISLGTFKVFDDSNGNVSKYGMYIPNGEPQNLPLIVIMINSDYIFSKFQNMMNNWYLEPFNAYILLQLKYNYNSDASKILANINEISNRYKIDKSKISLVGFSSSGYYMYGYAANNKGYFSSLLVLSAGLNFNNNTIQNNLSYFKSLPMKGFGENGGMYNSNGKLCEGYTTWSPDVAMKTMFEGLGKSNDYTSLGGMCHTDVMTYVFQLDDNNDNKSDIISWMIEK